MKNFCERLIEVIDYYADGRNTLFANNIGVRESNVRSWLTGTLPKIDVIEKIARNCDNLSLEWLILGEGNMIKPETTSERVETPPEYHSNDLITPLLDRIEAQAYKIAQLEIEIKSLRESPNKAL